MKKLILLMMFIAAGLMTCLAETRPIQYHDGSAVTVAQPYDVNCAVSLTAVTFDVLPFVFQAYYDSYALKPQSVIVEDVYPQKACQRKWRCKVNGYQQHGTLNHSGITRNKQWLRPGDDI